MYFLFWLIATKKGFSCFESTVVRLIYYPYVHGPGRRSISRKRARATADKRKQKRSRSSIQCQQQQKWLKCWSTHSGQIPYNNRSRWHWPMSPKTIDCCSRKIDRCGQKIDRARWGLQKIVSVVLSKGIFFAVQNMFYSHLRQKAYRWSGRKKCRSYWQLQLWTI
jgi:hypothetical protein